MFPDCPPFTDVADSLAHTQGSIVSAIGGGINAIISAIANVLETIISAIVSVRRSLLPHRLWHVPCDAVCSLTATPTGPRRDLGLHHGYPVLQVLPRQRVRRAPLGVRERGRRRIRSAQVGSAPCRGRVLDGVHWKRTRKTARGDDIYGLDTLMDNVRLELV